MQQTTTVGTFALVQCGGVSQSAHKTNVSSHDMYLAFCEFRCFE